MRRLISIFLIVVAIFGVSYYYIFSQARNAFIIDSSHEMIESAAPSLLNTEQKYGFRLVNASDKKIKLLEIELLDFEGIKINGLTVDGKPMTPLLIPSHRVYTSTRNWSTSNQGVNVEYLAEIMKETIKNPESAIITYSYMGIKQKQKIRIPRLE
ncbi:MAG TPA: hypothetical protein VEZ13_04025 [Brevibacillus sp.]|nr:hypothetical protein [Brevibacillus sp.]